jgi:two-component system chemotaxis response regulator CheB
VPLRVKVAQAEEPLQASTVYLAPEGLHLGASRRRSVVLSDEEPIGGFRPSGTYLFHSVAESFGAAAVALILTGMGEDGVEGLRSVKRAGGTVIAQDDATSIVFGMPGAAVRAGLADLVLPIDAMAGKLTELVLRRAEERS